MEVGFSIATRMPRTSRLSQWYVPAAYWSDTVVGGGCSCEGLVVAYGALVYVKSGGKYLLSIAALRTNKIHEK
jgi:hypothetical protein